MSSSSDASMAERVARIDATFADDDTRAEARAVLKRDEPWRWAVYVLAQEDGCSTCVECCYPTGGNPVAPRHGDDPAAM